MTLRPAGPTAAILAFIVHCDGRSSRSVTRTIYSPPERSSIVFVFHKANWDIVYLKQITAFRHGATCRRRREVGTSDDRWLPGQVTASDDAAENFGAPPQDRTIVV